MRIYDISVSISPGETPTYPGDPGIVVESWAAISRGDDANVSMLHFGAHTATHIDAPAHFIEGAPALPSLDLGTLVGQALVVEMPGEVRSIDERLVCEHVPEGTARVLFKTRNSSFWNNPRGEFRKDFTYVTLDGARALVARGVRLVGIDYLSIEAFDAEECETHIALLSRGIVIVEGLDLREVSAGLYELICLPLKIAAGSGDGAPARAVLRTLD